MMLLDNHDVLCENLSSNKDAKELEQALGNVECREMSTFKEWRAAFDHVDFELTIREQKRLLFCMLFLEGHGQTDSVIGCRQIIDFVLNVGPSFESEDWRTMCSAMTKALLHQ